MRVCYVLLMAMTTPFASNKVVAVQHHADVSKLGLSNEIQPTDTVQMTAAAHRFLRTHKTADEDKPEDEEERSVTLVSLMKMDDVVESKRFEAVLGRTPEARATRRAMFDTMYADKVFQTKVLKAIDEAGNYQSLKSMWTWYRVFRGAQYEAKVEAAAAAAARRKANP
ncbi:hypothetical protein ON010_g948 [Phytophthora cinnamomi]|nr:hypothetical protein ON010_g948 [Phytophthora cinnamomi]